ncbi:MAG: DUF2203 domain-containing protein [Dehalococcoidia bacterium]
MLAVMRERHFTLEEATALLPWLEETFAAMMPIRNELVEWQERLLMLLRRRRSNGHSSQDEALSEAQQAVDRLTRQLQDWVREIVREGIEVRDVGRGLVDFPSLREGREVYLCWLRGEAEIGYWHETDRGFDHRQPL